VGIVEGIPPFIADDMVELVILSVIIVWDELITVSVEFMTGETFITVCD